MNSVAWNWPKAMTSSGRWLVVRGRLKGQDGQCWPVQPTTKIDPRQPVAMAHVGAPWAAVTMRGAPVMA
jgi:hypothetical protein